MKKSIKFTTKFPLFFKKAHIKFEIQMPSNNDVNNVFDIFGRARSQSLAASSI